MEKDSGIAYALISLSGVGLGLVPRHVLGAPRLTAQCTRDVAGKLHFELLVDRGDVGDLSYLPPWQPSSKEDLFPPRLEKLTVTMEFLGYTKVKPVKRQWERLDKLPSEIPTQRLR